MDDHQSKGEKKLLGLDFGKLNPVGTGNAKVPREQVKGIQEKLKEKEAKIVEMKKKYELNISIYKK